jgi:hypothetical protein
MSPLRALLRYADFVSRPVLPLESTIAFRTLLGFKLAWMESVLLSYLASLKEAPPKTGYLAPRLCHSGSKAVDKSLVL